MHRWYQFQSASYLQSQADLLPLLGSDLASNRKKEVQRLAKKMQEESVAQEMIIKKVEEEKNGQFRVQTALELREGRQQTHLQIDNKIAIEKVPRTLENNWGLHAQKVDTEVAAGSMALNTLNLQPGKYTVLSFPCGVRNLSEVDPKILQFKLVTTKSSDLILTTLRSWEGNLPLTVECTKRTFSFQMKTAFPVIRYALIQETEGKPVVIANKKSDAGRSLIKQSLEKELGFEIEQDK